MLDMNFKDFTGLPKDLNDRMCAMDPDADLSWDEFVNKVNLPPAVENVKTFDSKVEMPVQPGNQPIGTIIL